MDKLLELSLKSPCFHPVFGPAFTPYPLSQWYPQSKENLLILSMKCWNSVNQRNWWKNYAETAVLAP
jgi:hypothetical protein